MRELPNDFNAETAVISASLIDNEALHQAVIKLTSNHFYHRRNRVIFTAIKNLVKKDSAVDLITVVGEIKKMREDGNVTTTYLSKVSDVCLSGANIGAHINILKEKASLRNIITESQISIKEAYDEKSSSKIIKRLSQSDIIQHTSLDDIKEKIGVKQRHAIKLSHRELDVLGYKFPEWPLIQRCFDGLQPGLYLFAGKEQTAKSMLMLILTTVISKHDKDLCVLYFSLDDSFNFTYYRLLSFHSGITINNMAAQQRYLRNIKDKSIYENEIRKINNAVDVTEKQLKKFILMDSVDGTGLSFIEETISEFSHTHKQNRFVVVIDNFNHVKTEIANGYHHYTALSRAIKSISVKYNIPLLMATELHKLYHFGRPTIDDLKETGALQYDADVVCLLHNDYRVKDGHTRLKVMETKGSIIASFDKVQYALVEPQVETVNVYPILEVNIAKNKLTGLQTKLYYVLKGSVVSIIELPLCLQQKCRKIYVKRSLQG